MRTNIEIDDQIMGQAMEAGGFKTKKETVEAALKLFQSRIRFSSRGRLAEVFRS